MENKAILDELELVNGWYYTGRYGTGENQYKSSSNIEHDLAKLIEDAVLNTTLEVTQLSCALAEYYGIYRHGLDLNEIRSWHSEHMNQESTITDYEIPLNKTLRKLMVTYEEYILQRTGK